ncbi:MAG TPA: serine hydrolase, partial [Candidatus Latescibacteria bacterium]|nr:serine hydrolase [Candidatus Latescibacterota bacterium]
MQTFERIEAELERIAADTTALIGVSFCHVESGQRLTLNAGEAFPMASTYKVAIAAGLLKRIDEQRLGLDEMIQITQNDLSPGGGIIRAHFSEPGVALSVHNLLTVMLTISDNTASDMLMGLAGGPEEVSDFLRSSGIEGMRVDRSTK